MFFKNSNDCMCVCARARVCVCDSTEDVHKRPWNLDGIHLTKDAEAGLSMFGCFSAAHKYYISKSLRW